MAFQTCPIVFRIQLVRAAGCTAGWDARPEQLAARLDCRCSAAIRHGRRHKEADRQAENGAPNKGRTYALFTLSRSKRDNVSLAFGLA